jgi:hypothetical protein
MTVHQKIRPGHCDKRECAETHAVQGYKTRQAEKLAAYRAQVKAAAHAFQPTIEAQAAQSGVAADRIHIGAVPHSEVPLIPLPEEKRAAYLAHLSEITEAAFALPAPAPQDIDRDYGAEQAEPAPWNNAACGTCRGFCCQSLGAANFAFQSVDTITALRQVHPGLTPEAVMALYEAALPALSNDGGCVFQGEQGCTLARSYRSDICNTFRCYALHRLADEIDPSAIDAVALVSVEDTTPHRMDLCVKGAP